MAMQVQIVEWLAVTTSLQRGPVNGEKTSVGEIGVRVRVNANTSLVTFIGIEFKCFKQTVRRWGRGNIGNFSSGSVVTSTTMHPTTFGSFCGFMADSGKVLILSSL